MNFKKIWASVMLLAIAVPVFFCASQLIKQHLVKAEMEHELKLANLQTITTSLKNIIWVEDEKEILIDGKLFDVESYTITNNQITAKGLFDNKEDEVVHELKKIQEQKNNSTNTSTNLLAKILLTPVYQEQNINLFLSIQKTIINTFYNYTDFLPVSYLSITSPPPKNLV